MNQLSRIETFWKSYLSTSSEADQQNAPIFAVDQFADTAEAATLVRDGIKTTTGSLAWGLDHIGKPLTKVSDLSHCRWE